MSSRMRVSRALTLLLLLAAMTPAHSDCVAYYSPVRNKIIATHVTAPTPVNYSTMQEMCNTQYPGYTLLGSTEITPQMAALCRGEVPLGVRRNGSLVTWYSPPGTPPKMGSSIELKPGSSIGVESVGVMNIGIGRWRLVDDDYTFTCAICEPAPKLHLNDAVYLGNRAQYSLDITGEASSDMATALGSIADELAYLLNVTSAHVTCYVNSTCLVSAMTLRPSLRASLISGVEVMGANFTPVFTATLNQVEAEERCTNLTTPQGTWFESGPGMVAVKRDVATHLLITRECMSGVHLPTWSNMSYWEEVWQPCSQQSARSRQGAAESVMTSFLDSCASGELPIPARRVEEFAEQVNLFVELKPKSDENMRQVLDATARSVLSTTFLDSDRACVETSSVTVAVVDYSRSRIGVTTSTLSLDVVSKTAEQDFLDTTPDTPRQTRVFLTVPDDLDATRMSFVLVNDTSAEFNTFNDEFSAASVFMAVLMTRATDEEIASIDSVTLSVRKTDSAQDWKCYSWDISGQLRDACNPGPLDDSDWSSFTCNGTSPNGYYLLRIPAARDEDVLDDDEQKDQAIRVVWIVGLSVILTVCACVGWDVVCAMRKKSRKWRRFKERVLGKYTPDEGFVVHEVTEHDDPEGSTVRIRGGRVGARIGKIADAEAVDEMQQDEIDVVAPESNSVYTL